jgi:hypothetical protein
MNHSRMQRLTSVFALVPVVLWISIFPLYMVSDPSGSLYDGAAIAQELFRIRNVVFTRILLGLV